MGLAAEIAILGASAVNDNGVPKIQGNVPVFDESTDTEPLGDMDLFQALGMSALPYQADASGYAEGVVLRKVGNRNAVLIGGRDTRSAKIVGKLKPGDTVVHSTGPSQAAQLQLKEAKRQAVLATKNSSDETMALVLDGKNDKFQLAVNGAMVEIDKSGNISLVSASGSAGIMISGDTVNIFGTVVLGGMKANPALSIMLGPVTGSPGGAGSTPMFAAKGVFIGS